MINRIGETRRRLIEGPQRCFVTQQRDKTVISLFGVQLIARAATDQKCSWTNARWCCESTRVAGEFNPKCIGVSHLRGHEMAFVTIVTHEEKHWVYKYFAYVCMPHTWASLWWTAGCCYTRAIRGRTSRGFPCDQEAFCLIFADLCWPLLTTVSLQSYFY